jgi:hypothetical protein
MSPPRIRAVGTVTVGTEATRFSQFVKIPARKPGDVVLIWALGYSVAAENVFNADVKMPVGAALLGGTVSDNSQYGRYWGLRVVASTPSTLALESDPDLEIDMWMTWAITVTNITPAVTFYDSGGADLEVDVDDAGVVTMSEMTVAGDDRLVLVAVGAYSFEGPAGVMTALAGFDTSYQSVEGGSAGAWASISIGTKIVSAHPGPAALTTFSQSDSTFWSLSIPLIGIDTTALPAIPAPFRLSLDCATSYTAWLTDADYRRRIDTVQWSSLSWGRTLDEVSSGQVVVPDEHGGVYCCVPFGQMRPWRFGLLVERNDIEVWSGPIVSVQRNVTDHTITLDAQDVLARYAKRFAVRDTIVDWDNTDVGVAWTELINEHARVSADSWFTQAPEVFVGASITRRVQPRNFEMAASILSELSEAALDTFVMNGRLYAWEPGVGWRFHDGYTQTLDGPYNDNFDFVYGLFTRDAWSEPPNWAMPGMDQATFVVVTGADQGEFGYRSYFSAESSEAQLDVGVLDHIETNPLQLPADTPPATQATVLQGRANTYLDLHALVPVTVQDGVLATGAPIDIENLRPGSLWTMDLHDDCFGQLLTVCRLKSVTVDVSLTEGGIDERIIPTLYPPGFRGGEVT